MEQDAIFHPVAMQGVPENINHAMPRLPSECWRNQGGRMTLATYEAWKKAMEDQYGRIIYGGNK